MTVDAGLSSTAIWQVIVPTGTTDGNYITNPSFEVNTTGWSTGTATLTRVVGGVVGGWMGRLLASATNGKAIFNTLPQSTAGTLVTASAWVKASSPLVRLTLTYAAVTTEQTHPGDGLWHRLEVAGVAQASTTPSITITDARTSAWTNVDFDGVQFEIASAATTYVDGDQDGCYWDVGAHQSISRRDGRSSAGGRITSLESLGIYIISQLGIGAPDLDINTQPLAIRDGDVYLQSRAKPRVLNLTGRILGPNTTAGLHTVRNTAIAPFLPDKRTNRGPIVLRYTGATIPKRIDTYLESGLGWEKIEGADETLPLRFLAPDPNWRGEADEQAALAPNAAATINHFLQRQPDGSWSTLSSDLAAGDEVIALAAGQDGVLYAGGFWAAKLGNTTDLARWTGTAWDALGTTNPNDVVHALYVAPNGDLIVGGEFTSVAGTTHNRIARYFPSSNTWDTATFGGGANNIIHAVLVDSSANVWVGGEFTSIGGNAWTRASYWTGSAWIDASIAGDVFDFALGPDDVVYCATATTSTGVYKWNGSTWVSIGAANNDVSALAWSPSGYLYAAGAFTTIGGVNCNRVARWNGSAWEPLDSGLTGGTSALTIAFGVDGKLYVGGDFTQAGSVGLPDSFAVWNGSSWAAVDVNMPTGASFNNTYAILAHTNGTLTLSWNESGAGLTPAISTVTTTGTASSYPKIVLTAAGRLYSITNLTTGQEIHFNVNIFSGERVTLDLRPGRKTFRSTYRELIGTILPGSDLDTFCLAPGANRLAVYCDDSSAVLTMSWRPQHWTADA